MQQFASTTNDNPTIIVLKKGEELMSVLNEFAKQQSLTGGWINVIGGAMKVTLGYYRPDSKEYLWRTFDESLEILGLQGNLAFVDGEPLWHIHGTFSRQDFSVVGGHVKDCLIGLTGEVHFQPHSEHLIRQYDDETGLNLISK